MPPPACGPLLIPTAPTGDMARGLPSPPPLAPISAFPPRRAIRTEPTTCTLGARGAPPSWMASGATGQRGCAREAVRGMGSIVAKHRVRPGARGVSPLSALRRPIPRPHPGPSCSSSPSCSSCRPRDGLARPHQQEAQRHHHHARHEAEKAVVALAVRPARGEQLVEADVDHDARHAAEEHAHHLGGDHP